jgi:hypothetical protein
MLVAVRLTERGQRYGQRNYAGQRYSTHISFNARDDRHGLPSTRNAGGFAAVSD